MARRRRVLLGGSFACDDALARPVQVLLQEATPSDARVDVEWLGYGSAVDLASLQEPLQHTQVNIVVLLVRLSDLRTAHPELQSVTMAESTDPHGESRLLEQLRAYDQREDRLTTPPLVVLFCPSPPSTRKDINTYQREEAELCRAMQSLQRVSGLPSSEATDFFMDGDTSDWYDVVHDKRAHAPFTQRMLHVLALRCVRQIARLWIRSPKKVVVLDCDNTLWGGAVADLGSSGIQLSARFLALQQFVVGQQKRGVLLCLSSKNIAQDVDAVFRERAGEMVLCQDKHIVVSKVNWRAKSQNLREIAQQLQLGLDAFVFVDDNAVECHEVQSTLPMVTVVHVPEEFRSHFLSTQWAFDTPLDFQSTDEDSERTKLYQQNAQRSELERVARSPAAFLSSLGIRIQCERLRHVGDAAFARMLQLHQRTNTFNVATSFSRMLTSERLAEYVTTPTTHFALASTVTDRYGHYGLVCATLFRLTDTNATVDTNAVAIVDSFLMSCRSLNRGVEHAMLKQIAETASARGIDTIRVAWEPTVRNEPVRMFFASLSTSVLATEDDERVTTRAEKIERSAAIDGWWQLSTSDAMKISFLREQQEKHEKQLPDQARVVAVPWRWRAWASTVRLVKVLVQYVARWMPRTWFAWLLSWLYKLLGMKITISDRPQDSTALSFHSCAQLDAFMAVRLDGETTAHDGRPLTAVVATEEDGETDEAFRLRVRYDTKLLLLDHISSDAPRVVWAPQRSDDVRMDEPSTELVESASVEALQQFHRPCATPSCTAKVYWESACAFQRCRTCCYRVQRLLVRATSDSVHAKSRAHAWASLADDFHVSANEVKGRNDWCSAHTNDRRRK